MMFSCRSTAALGVPVVPLVKSWMAIAPGSLEGSGASSSVSGAAATSALGSAGVTFAGSARRASWARGDTSQAGATRRNSPSSSALVRR